MELVMDRVKLKHPGLPGEPTFETTRAAFDVTWQHKGWEVVEDLPDEAEAAPAGPPENLDSMRQPQLEELAGTRGVDLTSASNNTERAALIRASYPEA